MKIHLLNEDLKYRCGSKQGPKGGNATQNIFEATCEKCLEKNKIPKKYRLPVETLELMNRKIKKGSHTEFVNLAILEKLNRMTEGVFSLETLKPEPNIFKVKSLSSNDGKRGKFQPFMVTMKELKPFQENLLPSSLSGYNQEQSHPPRPQITQDNPSSSSLERNIS